MDELTIQTPCCQVTTPIPAHLVEYCRLIGELHWICPGCNERFTIKMRDDSTYEVQR